MGNFHTLCSVVSANHPEIGRPPSSAGRKSKVAFGEPQLRNRAVFTSVRPGAHEPSAPPGRALSTQARQAEPLA